MAAPTATTRQTPSGITLKDGFRTLYTFAADPDISLWEMEATPPGMDNTEPIDTTTFWNSAVRTKAPRALYEVTDGAIVCAYDPAVWSQIQAIIGAETTVTCTLRDGSTIACYGYLKSSKKNNNQDGKMPTANVEIVFTCWDYVNKVEAVPVVTSVAGT